MEFFHTTEKMFTCFEKPVMKTVSPAPIEILKEIFRKYWGNIEEILREILGKY